MMTSEMPIRFLVYGGGSLGAFYPYAISRANPSIDFTAVCRSNYQEVRQNGYSVSSTVIGDGTFIPTRVVKTMDELLDGATRKPVIEFDYIMVTTKVLDPTKVEIPTWAAIPGMTSIILLQNGIGVEEAYKVAFPKNTIISVLAYISVQQPYPGKIVNTGKVNFLRAGIYSSGVAEEVATQSLQRFIKVLNDGGCQSDISPNIQSDRWRKTVWNACWNVVCAVTGLDTQAVLNSAEEATQLVIDLSWEIINTATRVLGVVDGEGKIKDNLSDDLREYWGNPEQLVKFNLEHARSQLIIPSMLQDAQKGREMEVEVICGSVLRHAQRLGFDTPVLRSLYTVLLAINHRFQISKL